VQLGPFDGIFWDTYGEYYEDMKDFHVQLPRLLRPGGIYSFFNGLAPDNIFFHLVRGFFGLAIAERSSFSPIKNPVLFFDFCLVPFV